MMNPDKCARCHQMVDPFDPEYCFWNGQRWHVSCALRQANDNIETMREKQGRHDTTAANYSALQAKIDDLMDQREGLLKILREVPQQANDLGLLFMKRDKLVKRIGGGVHAGGGHLLEGEEDTRTVLKLPEAERKLLKDVI
ncbi:hypothetical protein DRQ25_14595 [Candidatus Fermentibacteria bacterium]|nr:MAG: hypothetical protein DRQ25_14595 [Candidatus Fermentibacteria bacterium]